MLIGETYKSIRQNKNLTQKEICKGEVTTVTLSKFENGKSIPNYLLMRYFLNQINMSFEEFEFLCSQDNPSESQTLKMAFEKITSNTEAVIIQELIEKYEKYLENNRDESIQMLRSILIMTLDIKKKGFTDDAYQIGLQFWNDIIVKKEWYLDDLKLLNFILFYFPTDMVFDIVDRVLERLEEYGEVGGELNILKTSLLINLSTIYLQESNFERCKEIIHMAYKDAKKIKRYDFIAVCLVRKGILQQNKEYVQRGKCLLEMVGEFELLEELQGEVDKFYDRCRKVGK